VPSTAKLIQLPGFKKITKPTTAFQPSLKLQAMMTAVLHPTTVNIKEAATDSTTAFQQLHKLTTTTNNFVAKQLQIACRLQRLYKHSNLTLSQSTPLPSLIKLVFLLMFLWLSITVFYKLLTGFTTTTATSITYKRFRYKEKNAERQYLPGAQN
jgi:hypothetical protein